MTNKYFLAVCLMLLAACGEEPSAPEVQANTQPRPEAPAQAPAGGSNFGTIALRSGFLPDPHTARGTSGGSIAASTWNPACTGYVSQTPDHLLNAQSTFSTLRLLARADSDVTLVVQRPDGTYACNDDSDGTNPVVQIDNAAGGTYRIWVGSYAQGNSASYTLGVTELSTTMPSAL